MIKLKNAFLNYIAAGLSPQSNTLEKDMNPLILTDRTGVLLQRWLWYKITHKGWYAIIQRKETKEFVAYSMWENISLSYIAISYVGIMRNFRDIIYVKRYYWSHI